MADSAKVGGKWRLIWVWFPGSTPAAGKNDWAISASGGDSYLRTLLIHGARAVLNACKNGNGQTQPVAAGTVGKTKPEYRDGGL